MPRGTRCKPPRAKFSLGKRVTRVGTRTTKRSNESEIAIHFSASPHHAGLLRASYFSLSRKAAPGVDGVTWDAYGEDLENKINDLHGRIHRGAYRALPSRRRMIPKPDGRERPLGIASLEDKIVQRAVVEVLNAIYEADFVGFSYGFRPKRSQHDALDALAFAIEKKKVNWILDADLRAYFDTVSHEWLLRFLELRIGDRRIIRLIRKWLKAGVMEDGVTSATVVGTPQGAVVSPVLSNIYLHYSFDLWAHRWRRREARGEVIFVRYADDYVAGFQYEAHARAFLSDLGERLEHFGLSLHPDKTRLVEFGRYAAERRAERGLSKPETFTFLGFTHICGTDKFGRFALRRKTRRRPDAANAASGQGADAQANAPFHSRAGAMARTSCARLFRLPRCPDQHQGNCGLPMGCNPYLASSLKEAESKGIQHIEPDRRAGAAMASASACIASVADAAIYRQSLKVRA